MDTGFTQTQGQRAEPEVSGAAAPVSIRFLRERDGGNGYARYTWTAPALQMRPRAVRVPGSIWTGSEMIIMAGGMLAEILIPAADIPEHG